MKIAKNMAPNTSLEGMSPSGTMCLSIVFALSLHLFDDGRFLFVFHSRFKLMENCGKRLHIESGTTPNKPERKRATHTTRGTSKKSLCFDPSTDRTPLKEVTPPKSPSILTRLKGIRRSPKSLPIKRKSRIAWQRKEDVALVQFVAIHKDLQPTTSEWPCLSPKSDYWRQAADYLHKTTGTSYLREGSTVRQRVVVVLKGKYKTVDEAEDDLGITVESYQLGLDAANKTVDHQPAHVPSHLLSSIEHLGESQLKLIISKAFEKIADQKNLLIELATKSPVVKLLGSVTEEFYRHLPDVKKDILLNSFFLQRANDHGIDSNPGDFATVSLRAMLKLQQNAKPNLVYKWSRCLYNEEGKSSLDFERMPFGLIQYCMEFFSCTHVSQIRETPDFKIWQDTMDAEFGGGKFKRLFRGPMWSGLDRKDIGDPRKARVNVPCVSTQTQNKNLQKSPFSSKPEIQMEAIKELSKCNPKGRYWIKGDGTDVKAALQESMRNVWNGDVDLLDGKLQNLRTEYDTRISTSKTITTSNDIGRDDLVAALATMADALDEDVKFLDGGLREAVQTFRVKFNNPSTSTETLKGLNWDIVEFKTLLEQASVFKQKINDIIANLNPVAQQVPIEPNWRLWVKESPGYLQYLRNLFKKKRTCATHVLVFMVADEQRNTKPYAIPIQYVPYKGIRDQEVRDLTKGIKEQMTNAHLKVVGTSTDGEFEQLRRRGETRSLHIWQLAHDSRDSVSKMSKRTLLQMLEMQGVDVNGHPIVARPNPAIPHGVIFQLSDLRNNQMMSLEDAVTFIRGKLVPDGYTPFPFRRDTPESFLDKLRSVVATYQFRHEVQYWKDNGVDFSLYLYVPEVDPITGDTHHERADHNHLLKRIAKHTREGNNGDLNYERFDEAMRSPMTGLTHAALVGLRKQSVPDAEKLLSFHVAKFFRDNNYIPEADYVKTVAEWHEASDGRGLSQLQRCRQNYRMLNYILDEWIPWHRDNYDLSSLDVNKPIDGLRGFSRETVIELTTNIESQEFRRRQNKEIGHAENPRASETDDLECLYGMCHSWLGPYYTLKEFKQKWPKIVREFTKRMDPDLPFYYCTSNERFSVDVLPSFDEAPANSGDHEDDDDLTKNPYRLHRLVRNSRDDSSILDSGKSFLPAKNKTSLRQRFHRFDVGLPPVPQGQQLF